MPSIPGKTGIQPQGLQRGQKPLCWMCSLSQALNHPQSHHSSACGAVARPFEEEPPPCSVRLRLSFPHCVWPVALATVDAAASEERGCAGSTPSLENPFDLVSDLAVQRVF